MLEDPFLDAFKRMDKADQSSDDGSISVVMNLHCLGIMMAQS